jgi:hypothetical protein
MLLERPLLMTNGEFREFYTQTTTKLDRIRARIVALATKVEQDPKYVSSRAFNLEKVEIGDNLEEISIDLEEIQQNSRNKKQLQELDDAVDELLNTVDLVATGDAGALMGISDLKTYNSPATRGSRWSALTLAVVVEKVAPWIFVGLAAFLLIRCLSNKKAR